MYKKYNIFRSFAIEQGSRSPKPLTFRLLHEGKTSMLDFWLSQGAQWLLLRQLAKSMFCVETSSAASERTSLRLGLFITSYGIVFHRRRLWNWFLLNPKRPLLLISNWGRRKQWPYRRFQRRPSGNTGNWLIRFQQRPLFVAEGLVWKDSRFAIRRIVKIDSFRFLLLSIKPFYW